MKKSLLLITVLLTTCGSTDSDIPEITTYEECQMAGGSIIYNEPHECDFYGETYYENKPLAKFVDYGPATGYYASPVGGGPYPAIVLIHEKWGLENDIWAKARELAKEKYVVLAVDLYAEQKPKELEEALALETAVSQDLDKAFENIAAAKKWLSLQYNVTKESITYTGGSFGEEWDARMEMME